MSIRVEVVGVRVEMPSNQPIVLLKEESGQRYLPIWIGAVEATAIAFAQQGLKPQRPLTHDLLMNVLAASGHELAEVNLTEIKDGIFFAELTLAGDIHISARPSDAIALALRGERPIFVSEQMLESASIELNDEEVSALAQLQSGQPDEAEVAKFRDFLDQISPEDFLG